MNYLDVTLADGAFVIGTEPEGGKAVLLTNQKAQRLADYGLHQADLEFAYQAIAKIMSKEVTDPFLVEALWRTSVIHFMKCFGKDVRSTLSEKAIYKTESPIAMIAFEYFKNLRHMHFAHDANPFAQSIPYAVLTDGKQEQKVHSVECFAAFAVTSSNENIMNLNLLIVGALKHVNNAFDELSANIRRELELLDYAELSAMPDVSYRAPTMDDVSIRRSRS
jgi:hypothetical protein